MFCYIVRSVGVVIIIISAVTRDDKKQIGSGVMRTILKKFIVLLKNIVWDIYYKKKIFRDNTETRAWWIGNDYTETDIVPSELAHFLGA